MRHILPALAVLLLGCLCGGGPDVPADEPPAPAPAAAPPPPAPARAPAPPPAIQIGAVELVDACGADHEAAEARYKKQRMRITGKVNEPLRADVLGEKFFTLGRGGEDTHHEVQIYVVDEDLPAAEALTVGQEVVVDGKCLGSMLAIIVEDATFVR